MLARPDPPDEDADADGEEERLATGGPPQPELPQAAASSPHASGPASRKARRRIMGSSFVDQSCHVVDRGTTGSARVQKTGPNKRKPRPTVWASQPGTT